MGSILNLGIALLLIGILVVAAAVILTVVPDTLDNLGYLTIFVGIVLIIVALAFPQRVP
jgi:hypothetical protein